MANPKELLSRLEQSEIAKRGQVVGCTDEEIESLKQEIGYPLPAAYVLFLKTMGHGAGRLMDDLDIFYDGIIERGESARETMSGFGVSLPSNCFIFASHRDEKVFFFFIDGTDDPPIYRWIEGDSNWKRFADSVWEFVDAETRLLETIYRENKCSWKNLP